MSIVKVRIGGVEKEIESNPALVVTTIVETTGDYSQVIVAREVFEAVVGLQPAKPFATASDKQGRPLRVFDFNGAKLYSRLNRDTRTNVFIMKADEAKAHMSNENSIDAEF